MLSISKSTALSKIFEDLSQEDVQAILDWIVEHHGQEGKTKERIQEWETALNEWRQKPESSSIEDLKKMNQWLMEQNEALIYLLGKR